MSGEEQFTQVLEKIYAATLSESFWPDALRAVGGLFGADLAHFEVLDKGTGAPVFFRNEGASDDALAGYVEHYSAVSPRVAIGRTLPAGHVSCDYDFLTEAEMDRDEFYADFLRPQGYRYFVSANLINSDRTFGVFSVQRRIAQGHASAQEAALMRRLAPHLSQALRIHLRLAAQAAGGRADDLLFETSMAGVIYLDRSGGVLSLNPAARDMISDPRNHMDIRGGRLSIGQGADAAAVERLIGRAVATATGAGFDSAGAVAVRRLDALPLTVVAVPLPGGGPLAALTGAAPAVALLVGDPGLPPALPDALLRAVYGLTPAECRVAQAVLAGQSPAEYAGTAGIGIRTVRTHLSRVLGKTGARNQVELVRLLNGMPYRLR
jgi:DNA-binding CsgD family transcriptional regulator/PAS domain-containing protein